MSNPFAKQQTAETIEENSKLWEVLHTTTKTSEQVDAEMAAYFAEKAAKAAAREARAQRREVDAMRRQK